MKLFIRGLKLPSLLNLSVHWTVLARIKQRQRKRVSGAFNGKRLQLPVLPLIVTITRIGPKKLDDDNLAASCKYVRDQIAAEVGTDDGSNLYTWVCKQRIGPYGVEVEIEPREWW